MVKSHINAMNIMNQLIGGSQPLLDFFRTAWWAQRPAASAPFRASSMPRSFASGMGIIYGDMTGYPGVNQCRCGRWPIHRWLFMAFMGDTPTLEDWMGVTLLWSISWMWSFSTFCRFFSWGNLGEIHILPYARALGIPGSVLNHDYWIRDDKSGFQSRTSWLQSISVICDVAQWLYHSHNQQTEEINHDESDYFGHKPWGYTRYFFTGKTWYADDRDAHLANSNSPQLWDPVFPKICSQPSWSLWHGKSPMISGNKK